MNEKSCKIKSFFKRPHTPCETGLMVAAGVMAGVLIGLTLAPITNGIEISIGSHNGCGNTTR